MIPGWEILILFSVETKRKSLHTPTHTPLLFLFTRSYLFDLCEEKGHDENGSDDSSLSSPASQGNGEFGGTKDPSGLAKDTAKEISDHVTQGLGPNNGIETTPVAEPVVSEKTEHAEISQYPSPEKDNGKVATLPGSAAGTSRKVESIIKSEVPVSSEEKRLLLTGPPAVRTSWLSCCGLFDAVTGSDR
ncbi:PREDICTED: uncharacterized protein LOC106302712 [Brassica oleracea var. oleracea]|uniref:uncharacterized protein LOC106302712 n=1 Tax=Brassica oleracea var. oleracea TaxID=109376 RepID=UPI0006A6AB23|nr:PREDICTED: uncharacterized protein LOC106302712 [Brassica oleracea var. oleracea]